MKLISSTPKRPTLTIEFTSDELDVLAVICAKIAGNEKGPRGVADKFRKILLENGYEYLNGPFVDEDGFLDKNKVEGSIYFKD